MNRQILRKFYNENSKAAELKYTGKYYRNKDVVNLVSLAEKHPKGVDFLLTNEWPQNFHHMSNAAKRIKLINSISPFVTEVVVALRPRFHIVAGENVFFQRESYVNFKG